ncbi:MAG: outer membrane lipoprotein carrier protein LolA [Alphaproteobacteria bacterium]
MRKFFHIAKRRLATALFAALLPCAPSAGALDAADQADIARVERYLNNIRTMRARFIQIAPDGGHAQGTIYLSRPDKLRVEYDPPTPILMITTKIWLIYYDSELGQVSYLPLATTPAEFLVRDSIRLDEDIAVTDIERGLGVLRVSLVGDDIGAGSLTLTFSDNPLELKQWQVIDARGQKTRIALTDTRFGLSLDPGLFKFVDPTPKHRRRR